MIQTNYVALERPYRVIYYNGVVGLQIGSLVVTAEKQDEAGGSIIEIKSHPVVSYCTTKTKKKINSISYPGVYSEAVVWDQVEQNEVITLCIEGGCIDCEDFLEVVGQDLWKRGLRHGMRESTKLAYGLQHTMKRLGIKVTPPPTDDWYWECNVFINTWKEDGVPVCGDIEMQWPLFKTPIDEDENKTIEALMDQRDFWACMTSVCCRLADTCTEFLVHFKPDVHTDDYQVRLSERLNQEQETRLLRYYENKDNRKDLSGKA